MQTLGPQAVSQEGDRQFEGEGVGSTVTVTGPHDRFSRADSRLRQRERLPFSPTNLYNSPQ